MDLDRRIETFSQLGDIILSQPKGKSIEAFHTAISIAHTHNAWFTPEFCRLSIETIAKEWLDREKISPWVSLYPQSFFNPKIPKAVGVVMAGNVPFVGFHDMLCVLITGSKLVGKVSSKDAGLTQALVDLLIEIEPKFSDKILITDDKLENFDAIIATGSNNSARYFDYYFGKYPNIIRRNRQSIGVLSGDETPAELRELAADILTYFGLGCRNVSKILVPKNYDFKPLIGAMKSFVSIKNHNKYANNFEYHQTIYLMNQVEFKDCEYILLKPDESLGSPVGVLFYQYYSGIKDAIEYIKSISNSLQCVVSKSNKIPQSIPFGHSQKPRLTDYADGIDTIEFLGKLQ